MTRSYLLVVFLLSVMSATSLLSCKDQGRAGLSGRQEEIVLIPLEIGRSWSYVMTTYDSLGNATATRRSRTTVVGDTVTEGRTWFILQDDPAEVPTNAANKDDGLYLLADGGQEIQLYKYPASVGDECPPYTVVSVDTTISSTAGSFECYQYHYFIDGHDAGGKSWVVTVDDFVAPGVGMVKHEVVRVWKERGGETPGGREVVELVER